MQVQEEKKTISVTEASKEIGVCTATIRRAIKTGKLKAFRLSDKINATYRIPVEELKKLFCEQ